MHEINIPGDALADLAGEILRSGGSFSFRANGSSMYPFLPNGTILTIVPVRSPDLALGDVVLYRVGNRMAAHRIVGIGAEESGIVFKIKGDNCTGPPHRITESEIMGLISAAEIGPFKIAVNRRPWKLLGRLWAGTGVGPLLIRLFHQTYLHLKKVLGIVRTSF